LANKLRFESMLLLEFWNLEVEKKKQLISLNIHELNLGIDIGCRLTNDYWFLKLM